MTLRALIEAVERGEWTVTHWRDFEAIPNGSGDAPGPILAHRAYHGSLDAAIALKDALLPGWSITIIIGARCHVTVERGALAAHALGEIRARALLLAILRAVEAEGKA